MSEPVEQSQPHEEAPSSPQKGNQPIANKAGTGPRNPKYENRRNSRSYNQKGNGTGNKHFQKYNQSYGVHAGYIPNYGVADYSPMYYNQYQQQQQMYAAYQSPMGSQAYMSPGVASPPLGSKPAKVEITNKSGEHIDIASIAHHHAVPVVNLGGSPAPAALSVPVASQTPAPAAASNTVKVQVGSGKEPSSVKEEEPKKDNLIVNDFLEQVKRRKAQLAAKKASGEKPEEKEAESSTKVAVEETEKTESEPESAEPEPAESVPEQPAEPKPLTLAEKLKLKRMEAAKQAGQNVPEEISTTKKDEEQVEEIVKEESVEQKQELKDQEALVATEETSNEAETAAKTQPEAELEAEAEVEPEAHTEPEAEDEVEAESVESAVALDAADAEDVDAEETADVSSEFDAKTETENEVDDSNKITMTDFLKKINEVSPVDDIYSFAYPSDITPPNDRYKKDTVKYTYGPEFLYQFKDKVDVKYDPEWMADMTSKIVIPPRKANSSGRGEDRFSKSKVGSLRGEGRSNSRTNSKRKSKKDDRRSNRSYTSRKDRERIREEDSEENKIEVAPLIPSANRWVPKSKMKKSETVLAPDGTELYDAEEVSRKMKSLLNKLTLEMFDPISDDIMKIANQSKWQEKGETLKIVIEQIFYKACDEPHWSSMYAQLCGKVVKDLDDSIKDTETPDKTGSHLVLHYLVQRCQTEFQKGWTDKLPSNEDGTPLQPEMMSDDYYKQAAAKRRGLGLVRFIGFLFRSNLLTSRMVFFCFKRLMKDIQNSPTEDTLESVCELLETIGEQFESAQVQVTADAVIEGSSLLDTLFDQIKDVVENGDISSRIKFKLMDIVELREKKHWNSTKKNDGPKTIAQIHEEEALKRAMDERERERDRHGSKGGSRRMNSERASSRREAPASSHNRDGFTTTRSTSVRYTEPKKEEPAPTPTKSSGAANMFDALMDAEDD